MGKTIVVLILIAGAGFFIYERLGQTPSEEMQLVRNLSQRYEAVVARFSSAQSRAGLMGDSIFDAGAAATQMLEIRRDLADVTRRLTEEKAIQKAAELSEKVETFCKKNDIQSP